MLDEESDFLKDSNGNLNFDLFAMLWSGKCSGSNYIYYKTPENLRSYFNILEDRNKYRDSVAFNIEISRSVRGVAQSDLRFKESIPAKKKPRLILPQQDNTVLSMFDSILNYHLQALIASSIEVVPRSRENVPRLRKIVPRLPAALIIPVQEANNLTDTTTITATTTNIITAQTNTETQSSLINNNNNC